MRGSLAQLITLTVWGNAALRAPASFTAGKFYPAHPAFRFCEYVQFVDLSPAATALAEFPYAADPIAWFERMQAEGVYTLRLVYKPADSESDSALPVGFSEGGERWLIEAVKPAASDYWEARWDSGDYARDDRKIWRVTYGRIAANAPSEYAASSTSMVEVKQHLLNHLPKMVDFALAHYEDGFARLLILRCDYLTSRLIPIKPLKRSCCPQLLINFFPLCERRGCLAAWVRGMTWLSRVRMGSNTKL